MQNPHGFKRLRVSELAPKLAQVRTRKTTTTQSAEIAGSSEAEHAGSPMAVDAWRRAQESINSNAPGLCFDTPRVDALPIFSEGRGCPGE